MRIIVKYISIAIVFTVLWTLIEHVLGWNTTNHETGQYARLLSSFVYWGCIIAAIIEVKKHYPGKENFRKMMNTGVWVAVGYSLLVTIWYAVYAEVINPDYQQTLMAFHEKKMMAEGAPKEKIVAKLRQVKMESGGSVSSYLLLFFFMAMFGIGITLITSVIVKNRQRKN